MGKLYWGHYNGFSGWYSLGTVPVPNPGASGTEQAKNLYILGGTEGKVNNWNGYDSCVVSASPVGFCEVIGIANGYGLLSKMLVYMYLSEKAGHDVFHEFFSHFADRGYFINTQTEQWEHVDDGPVNTRNKLGLMWHGLPTWEPRDNPDEYWEQYPNSREISKENAQKYLALFDNQNNVELCLSYCSDFIDRTMKLSNLPRFIDSPRARSCWISFYLNNQAMTRKVFSQAHLDSGLYGDALADHVIKLAIAGHGLDVWKDRAIRLRSLFEELYP